MGHVAGPIEQKRVEDGPRNLYGHAEGIREPSAVQSVDSGEDRRVDDVPQEQALQLSPGPDGSTGGNHRLGQVMEQGSNTSPRIHQHCGEGNPEEERQGRPPGRRFMDNLT